ncbi:hypothetical protein C8A01DRAFT_39660, partial [Parachaetomium inaequale]
MSFRPVSLAVFFPPELQLELQAGSQPSADDQETTPSVSHHMHLRTTSHELDSTVDSLTHAHSLSSTGRTHKESSSDTWDDTEPFEGEEEKVEEYWEENEEEEDTDQEEYEDASGPLQHVWISDKERQRVAYKRARVSAERVDLDRSPFFPKTVAEYVGLKAGMLEARAARLRAKVQERERVLWAKENARWKRVFVVGYSGETEEIAVPVYYEDQGEGKPVAPAAVRPSSAVGNGEPAVQLEQTSNTNFGSGPFCPPGPVATGIDISDPWPQAPYFPGPVTTANINANYHWVPAYYFPDSSLNTAGHWPQPCYVACPVTLDWPALYARDLAWWEANPFQTRQENTPWPWVDAAWFGPQANDAVNYNHGFQLPPTSAAGHQRARSATFLREVAAHAAIRRGVEQHGQSKPDSAPDSQGWFEDDGYDSDSSFTPSDYRLQPNTSKGEARDKTSYEACISRFSDDFFTPNNYTTQPAAVGKLAGNGQDKVDGHFSDEHNGHNKNENGLNASSHSRPTPGDYQLDKFKFYRTLDGKMEAKGKDKREGYVQHGQAHVHNEHIGTTKDEGSTREAKGNTETESNDTQSDDTKPEANPPAETNDDSTKTT